MNIRTSLHARLAFACLVIASPASHADIAVFTTQASFLAAVSAPGVDTFAGFSTTAATASPVTRSAGPYTYGASSASGFFGAGNAADPALSTNSDTDVITFFDLGGASAIGGLFFGSDTEGGLVAAAVVLTVTDTLGAVATRTFVATSTSFIGFVSDAAIATLVFGTTIPGQFVFPAVDNLTLAAAAPVTSIPEPETLALVLAGLAAIGLRARRERFASRSTA